MLGLVLASSLLFQTRQPRRTQMELIDLLFFPGVVIAGILLWAFATYDKKLASERIYANSLRAKQRKKRA
jgi:hypothetical protein